MSDAFTTQLSPYLDGELDDLARSRLEAHLATCVECRSTLADLRAIVTAAPFHPGREPSRDLWKDIAARLDEAEVVPIGRPEARPEIEVKGRRFGWSHLVAASLLMAAIGGGAAWLALRNPSQPAPLAGTSGQTTATPDSRLPIPDPRTAAPATATPDSRLPIPVASTTKTFAYAEEQYDHAVHDLERILDSGRGRLDTATVRTIEQSLRKIDDAIAEAQRAIQRDPANEYLKRQIAANMRRKLDLLRVATKAIASQS